MRLNRGTIFLVIIALVVIVGALILNNNQAAAPGVPTSTPGTTSVAVFPDVRTDTVTSAAVRDNTTGAITQLIRAGENWAIQATNATDRAADPDQIETLLSSLVTLQGEGAFEAGTAESPLSRFGLDQPAYTVFLTTADQTFTVYIGNKNPAGNRYYAVVETSAEGRAEATAEASAGLLADPNNPLLSAADEILPEVTVEPTVLEGARTVVLVNSTTVNSLIDKIDAPPYGQPTTVTPTPHNMLNTISEGEQTETAAIELTAAIQAQQTMLAVTATAAALEATPEATDEPTA